LQEYNESRQAPVEKNMTRKDEDRKEKETERGNVGPMAMGMEMAKKMMGQMGQGGPGPMAIMQKMMAQMSKGQEGGQPMPPMMQMCMGMCAEMLTAIKRTTDLAALATPELNQLFNEWRDTLERDALRFLSERGGMNAEALAKELHISEPSAVHLIAHLAKEGKITMRVEPSQETQ
jgi:hypothetical protein